MQVIALCGYAGSGKDTAAEALVQQGWKRIAFADPIREMALAIDPYVQTGYGPTYMMDRLSRIIDHEGWDGAKRWSDVRRLLQRIGTEAGREILGDSVWVNVALAKIWNADECHGVVITDLRFVNEYTALGDWNAKFIRITRPGIGPVNDHQSDQHLAGFEVDHEIVNDGTREQLWEKIREIAK